MQSYQRQAPYTNDIPARASRFRTATQQRQPLEEEIEEQQARQKHHSGCALPLGIGMCIMLALYFVTTLYILPFLTSVYDHWEFGAAHISTLDTTINGTPTHFIAEDVHGRILIFEFPVSEPKETRIFMASASTNTDGLVVSLVPSDVNNDGKMDIVVAVQGSPASAVLYSNGHGGFSWTSSK